MVSSYAIEVEKVTDPDFLMSLQQEVDDIADDMSVEIILLLVDKWEKEFQQKLIEGEISLIDTLNYYIKLKISLHHLIRKWERGGDWGCEVGYISQQITNLSMKTKEARKNYYVTKRRYEGQHRSNCACRGCRCIKGI